MIVSFLILIWWSARLLNKADAKRAGVERELRESEHNLNLSQGVTRIGSWGIDFEKNQGWWSNEAYRLFGYEPHEVPMTQELFIGHVHPSDKDMMLRWMGDCAANIRPPAVDMRIIRRDGAERIFRGEGSAYFEGERLLRMVGTVQDVTERKQAEEQLHLQSAALEAAADAIAVTDKDGLYVWVNKAFETLTGYARAEAIGKNPRILKSGKQDASFYKELWETILSGNVWWGKIINRRKDGVLYVEEQSITPVRRSDGEVTHFVSVKRDISERVQLQDQLIQSEEKWRSVATFAPDMILVADTNATIQFINHTIPTMTVEQVVGRSIYEFVPEKDSPLVRTYVEGALSTGAVSSYEILGIDQLWYFVRVGPIRQGGEIAGVSMIITDITGMKRAEEAVRRSESTLRSFFDSAGMLMGTVEIHGDDIFHISNNRYSEEFFGVSRGSMDQRYAGSLGVPREFIDLWMRHYRRAEETREPVRFEYEHCWERSNKWLSATVSSIPAQPDAVSRYAFIVEDVTAKKSREEAIRLYAEKLERSNQELDQFAYVASHDLQEPVRTISGYAQLLAKRYAGKLDNDADEFIRFIVEGSDRMKRLLQDVLRLSRVTTKAVPSAAVNMNEVLRAVADDLRFSIEEAGATLTNDPLPEVVGDAEQLRQALQNLIGNAIKFHDTKVPVIHVSARQEGDATVFSVQDNGIGIDPKFFDRIFLVFQRLHTREEIPGSGIGLALCKKIVERHGGRIWVESEEGHGSTFSFTLPHRSAIS
ncbi:MAG TPA: hypothetical protein DCP63_03980 [Bacteroidetes bacterium]|nr:hypothetical protein [Bacteroidota bacterium]